MENIENNKIIKIYRELDKAFFDKYYAEHDFDSILGGRVIGSTLQLRLGLGHILGTKGNVKIFNKIINIFKNPKECDFDTVYYNAVIDLFITNLEQNECIQKYWEIFANENSDIKEIYLLSSLYDFKRGIDENNKDEFLFVFDGAEIKDPNVFPDPSFYKYNLNREITGLLTEFTFGGNDSFFRIYEIFDIRDKKCQSQFLKYIDLNYGLDKFEKKVF